MEICVYSQIAVINAIRQLWELKKKKKIKQKQMQRKRKSHKRVKNEPTSYARLKMI